jgi:hypothetical protein
VQVRDPGPALLRTSGDRSADGRHGKALRCRCLLGWEGLVSFEACYYTPALAWWSVAGGNGEVEEARRLG